MDVNTIGENHPEFAEVPVTGLQYCQAGIIAPVKRVLARTGNFYYNKLNALVTAQTGRTANVAPTGALYGNGYVAYEAIETIDRKQVPYGLVDELGGLQAALLGAAGAAKENVVRKLEANVAAAVMTSTTNAVIHGSSDSFLTDIETAKQAIRRVSGKTALVLSEAAFTYVMQLSVVSNALLKSVGTQTAAQVMREDTLAALLGIDVVLKGADFAWSTYWHKAALIKLPSAGDMDHLNSVQSLRTLTYFPAQGAEYNCTVFGDGVAKCWDVDVNTINVVKILNGEGIQVLDTLNGVTTTTTTTTTGA